MVFSVFSEKTKKPGFFIKMWKNHWKNQEILVFWVFIGFFMVLTGFNMVFIIIWINKISYRLEVIKKTYVFDVRHVGD